MRSSCQGTSSVQSEEGAGHLSFRHSQSDAAAPSANALQNETAPQLSVDPLYVDDYLLAVSKPAGMLSVPGRGPAKQDCAARRVLDQYADALVVHRLDQATSGVLLFARGPHMQRALSAAFEARAVRKQYVAVVAGHLGQARGTIELPLSANWPLRPKQMVNAAEGKPAITHYELIAHAPGGTSRVLLRPLTGRTHQLRVHLAAIGHPIVGDTLYAPDEVARASTRLLLHAHTLAFAHPGSGETVCIEAPWPF
jgi:tRNA pseudouridine32 synthase/23S rRNA pseudouridine746 synthase